MFISKITGISLDYSNEYSSVQIYCANDDPHNLCRHLNQHPVLRYTERFSPDEFEDVITSKNESAVRRINEIADILNTYTVPEHVRIPDVKRLIEEVILLVSGKEYCHDLFGSDPEKRWKLWRTTD